LTELLSEVEVDAESTKTYHHALHVFTDWFSGKPVELFRLTDQSGGKNALKQSFQVCLTLTLSVRKTLQEFVKNFGQ